MFIEEQKKSNDKKITQKNQTTATILHEITTTTKSLTKENTHIRKIKNNEQSSVVKIIMNQKLS